VGGITQSRLGRDKTADWNPTDASWVVCESRDLGRNRKATNIGKWLKISEVYGWEKSVLEGIKRGPNFQFHSVGQPKKKWPEKGGSKEKQNCHPTKLQAISEPPGERHQDDASIEKEKTKECLSATQRHTG